MSPLKYALCPDGKKTEVTACLNWCPLGDRCLPLPTLHAILWEREWTGTPSTTQLINGTRLEYLKLTCDYGIDPKDRAFALLGTWHHGRLQAIAKKLNVLSEEKLEGEVTGIFDLLEPDEQTKGEAYILTDYKTSGSFKVAQWLGLVGHKVPDPSGAVYQRNGDGYQKGDPKMVTEWTPDPSKADLWSEELQLNNYRLMVEALGFPVSRMRLQVTVRDGGTFVAENRGIMEKMYMIPVKRLEDEHIETYFALKKQTLQAYLSLKEIPLPCSARESWAGRRCAGYCDVAEFCSEGGK